MNRSDDRAIWLGRYALPHEQALRAWLRGRRLNGLQIDDIIQETYTRLINLESVDHILDSKTYMFRTANSVVASHLRRMKVISIRSISDLEQLEVISSDPSPERQVIDRDELAHLADAIAALPAKARQVFILRRVQGLSQRDVSQRLRMAESTVEKHMGRAFLLLNVRLFHGGNGPTRASSSVSRIKFNKGDAKNRRS